MSGIGNSKVTTSLENQLNGFQMLSRADLLSRSVTVCMTLVNMTAIVIRLPLKNSRPSGEKGLFHHQNSIFFSIRHSTSVDGLLSVPC